MQIPKRVKVGGVWYDVIIADEWHGGGGIEFDGETVQDQEHGNVIYIASYLSQEAQEETFFHEILHALNSTMDHEFLDSLSEQLYQVFKDNNLMAKSIAGTKKTKMVQKKGKLPSAKAKVGARDVLSGVKSKGKVVKVKRGR